MNLSYYFDQGGYVLGVVSLFVYLSFNSKSYVQILMKFSINVDNDTKYIVPISNI